MPTTKAKDPGITGPISLKNLAEYQALNVATVSVVLNDVPGPSIPGLTRERIKAAARQLNYEPTLLAPALRSRRKLTVGIAVPELGDGHHTQLMSGIGGHSIEAGCFYFTDLTSAAFNSPRLATIRQPLKHIGNIAAQYALNRIHNTEPFKEAITVEPEFVVGESTAEVKSIEKSDAGARTNAQRTLGDRSIDVH